MLSEIRNRNFALKSVADRKKQEEEEEAAKKKTPAAASGPMSSIMDILARRSAIKGSDDEEGSGNEWD